MQEKKIIDGLRMKNQESLSDFRKAFSPLINYILSPILKDSRDKEECLSDIVVTVWERIDTYDESKGSFTTWLTVISRNLALNKARSRNRINLNEEEMIDTTPSKEITPEEAAIKREQAKLLQKAIGTLSKETFDAAVEKGGNAIWFATNEEFLQKADEILKDGDAILIKASHFMDFPKIVEALQ